MRFQIFKEFKVPNKADFGNVVSYLSDEVAKLVRELNAGLSRLRFEDNFSSFTAEVTIPAGQEITIRNGLRNAIPSMRIVIRGDGSTLVDGDQAWSRDFVYLKNTGGTAITAKVLFLE